MTVAYGLWSHSGGNYNVAFADGRLYIEAATKPNLVGGIARGQVDRIVGTAVFVKLPGGAMGYLEKAKGAKPGDELLVQVSTYATADKAWPLSTELKLQSRRYIHLPHGRSIAVSKRLPVATAEVLQAELQSLSLPGGWIIRSATAERSETNDFMEPQNVLEALALVDQAKALQEKTSGWLIPPPSLVERAQLDNDSAGIAALDTDAIAERMEALLRLELPLPGGGRLRLGPTPALFTIDLDLGAATDLEKHAADAAAVVLHAIRSRAVAGQIVIDPVRAGAKVLLKHLQRLTQGESPPLTIYGQTKMGLIELSRPRLGPSLYEALDD